MTSACQRRSGFTLIEMLIAMTIFAIVTTITGIALLGLMKAYQADTELFNRMQARSQLAEQFRNDVALAESVTEPDRQIKPGPEVLALKRSGQDRFVYRWTGQEVERTETLGDDIHTSNFSLGSQVTSLTFEPRDRMIVLRLTEIIGTGDLETERVSEWVAGLGGDRR